jgi:hypothetical protein
MFAVLPAENRLSADPTVIDFGQTYPHAQFPIDFDGAAYLRNVPIQINWSRQLMQSRANYVVTLNLFRHKGPLSILLALSIALWASSRKLSFSSRWLPLIGISAVPFVLYPLVHVEYRYLAPYLFLGAVSAWAWVTTVGNIERRWVVLLCGCLLGGILADIVPRRGSTGSDQDVVSFACCTNPYRGFMNELKAAGFPDGGRIALVGEPRGAHFISWLNPGHYRLQAVITNPAQFFDATPTARARIERELFDRGSRLLLAPRELIPRAHASAWRPLSLGYAFQFLTPD